MLTRAVVRRCPWCGGRRAFFVGWFGKAPHCHTCGLRWRRGDVGFELGAAAVAAIITLGPLILGLAAGLAVTWPDTPVAPLLAVLIPAACVLPIVTYPLSYTIWQAIDLSWREVEPDHFDAGHIMSDALSELTDD